MHILFELTNRFGAKCMGDCFALPGMLMAVTGVEEPAVDGYEGVVVLAVRKPSIPAYRIYYFEVLSYLFRNPFP